MMRIKCLKIVPRIKKSSRQALADNSSDITDLRIHPPFSIPRPHLSHLDHQPLLISLLLPKLPTSEGLLSSGSKSSADYIPFPATHGLRTQVSMPQSGIQGPHAAQHAHSASGSRLFIAPLPRPSSDVQTFPRLFAFPWNVLSHLPHQPESNPALRA